MWNARLDEVQAGIKIARRNINSIRYADDITLMAEREEEQNTLLMKVIEESKIIARDSKIDTDVYRSVLWTLWERERVGRFGRMALKHV